MRRTRGAFQVREVVVGGAGLLLCGCWLVFATACGSTTCDPTASETSETTAADVTGQDVVGQDADTGTDPCAARECGLVPEPGGAAGSTLVCGWCADGKVCRAGACVEVPCFLAQDCASESPLLGGLTHACVRPDFETAGTCRYAFDDQGEVLSNLQRIYEGAALYLGRERVTVEGESVACAFPANQGVTPIEGTCCSLQGGPDRDADNRCDADPAAWDEPIWSDLGFTLAGAHELVYRFGVDEVPAGRTEPAPFVIEAYGDLDCNTLQETFTVVGARDPASCRLQHPASIRVSLPVGNHGNGTPAVTVDVALSESQRAPFLGQAWYAAGTPAPVGVESVNPHFDEAKLSLQRLAEGLAAAWEKGAPGACGFPAALDVSPIEATCCSAQGGYDVNQNDLCDVEPLAWEGGWADLGFALTTEHAFVYATGVVSPTRAKALAYADLDCDTIQSTFARFVQGTDTGAACEATILPGWYIENENE